MKRSYLSYKEWKCITKKKMFGKNIKTDLFEGYVGVIDIEEVSEPQIWKFNGEDMVVCDHGLRWISILPKNDFYCITAMLNEKGEILVWYIDMIANQGITEDGIPFFDDLYLDLVVYPDGTVLEDDMDELEDALEKGDITSKQYDLAIATSRKLQEGMLNNIKSFVDFTFMCLQDVI